MSATQRQRVLLCQLDEFRVVPGPADQGKGSHGLHHEYLIAASAGDCIVDL
jgi:hypothetical protein